MFLPQRAASMAISLCRLPGAAMLTRSMSGRATSFRQSGSTDSQPNFWAKAARFSGVSLAQRAVICTSHGRLYQMPALR